MRTYHTRLQSPTAEAESLLEDYAVLYGHVERTLFSDMQAGKDPAKIGSDYLKKYKITRRQFSAAWYSLKGKISSIKETRKLHIKETKQRIQKAKKVLKVLKKSSFVVHQKKRRLKILEDRLDSLKEDQSKDVTRLCFGSKKLFRKQFYLNENNYSSHLDWKKDWIESRSNKFFIMGSKDETSGCQTCVITHKSDITFNLRLRLPYALKEKYLHFSILVPYGTNMLLNALKYPQAISYIFLKDKKGWRVFIMTNAKKASVISNKALGVIGVDINANHLALSETDRFGNPIKSRRVSLVTYGCSTEQAEAKIGDAVKEIIEIATKSKKPISIEKLDFSKKKSELESEDKRYKRMLSSFLYSHILELIKARATDSGIEVKEVNPAYSSVIGRHKFMHRYGVSSHQSAALVIGRRALYLSERPNSCKNDHGTPPLPVRNRAGHVWSYWNKVLKGETAHVAQLRRLNKSSSVSMSNRQAHHEIMPLLDGEIPSRESSTTLFG